MWKVMIAVLLCSACSSPGSQEDIDNVYGVWIVEAGYQTIRTQKGEQTDTFTLENGVVLNVEQSGSAVKFFTCMGELKNGQVNCDFHVEKDVFGIKQCETVVGTLEFNGTLMTADIHMTGEVNGYEELNWESNVSLKLMRARPMCEWY